MKIDVSGGYSVFSGRKAGESAKIKEGASEKAKRTADIADFSHGSTAISDKSFVSLKSAIQRDINSPASPERLGELRSAIRNGSYHVPMEALVNSILGE